MSYLLYRHITHALCFVGRPYLAARRSSGSPEWKERCGVMPDVPRGGVWVHAASVGEIAAAVPLTRSLSELGVPLLLTVVTRTGREVAERALASVDAVSFAPLDCVRAVRSALTAVRPRALVLVETELWPNLIVEASECGVAVGVVNARLSPAKMRSYRLPLFPFRAAAQRLSFVACQTEADMDRYLAIGAPQRGARVAGNTKYDVLGGPLGVERRSEVRANLGIADGTAVVVFGCVRPREERAVASVVADVLAMRNDVCAIVAPRHIGRIRALSREFDTLGVPYTTRSLARNSLPPRVRTILLDSTGELSEIYGIATAAFVGGTLAPYGGHNPLEPAARGVPVLYGPHTTSSGGSAELLVRAGAGLVVRDSRELSAALNRLLSSDAERESMARSALAAVESGRGAAARTILLMREVGVLDGVPPEARG